ncbi:hypothetical protein ACGFZL_12870 [Streptomyces sp. NPDC048182]|uniref:hypothetical protein n=1 Tax=Streptomyces sp. NPDC048182 TaxID=3365507 RepID=UPI003722938C
MALAPSPPFTDAAPPPSRGGLGLAQGRYGARGNLELVLCDERDGLWVLWHNTDPEGAATPEGAPPPGEWSGALRFAAGRRYDDVRVLQSRNGPDHLEVLARSGTDPHRLRWSPEAAFTPEDPPPGRLGPHPTLTETADGALWTALAPADGEPVRPHRADPAGYPRLTWSPAGPPVPPQPPRTVLLAAGPDADRPATLAYSAEGARWTDPRGRSTELPGAAHAACAWGAHGPLVLLADGDAGLLAVRPRPLAARAGAEPPRPLPLPGTGTVTALAATPVRHDPGRTDLVLRRGGALWHLTDRGPGTEPVHRLLTSRLNRDPADPAPVHRR